MRTLFLLPLLFLAGNVLAQKLSEKDLEKMAAEAEKMAEKVMKDPRYKKAMADAGVDEDDDEAPERFPAKNKAMMATVPSQPMNKGVMSSYLSNLYTAYKTKMPIGAVQAAQQAGIKLGNDPDKLGVAAVTNWYNGAPKEAILMAITASMKNPDNKILLNNLGALLNMGGAPYHALPILKTLVSEFPNNPMFLNNLGQAYTGAGELDTAMYYFRRCIQESPNHPEANNTAGHIEQSRGNTEAAAQHFEKSLRGGFNEGAAKGLDKTGEGRTLKLSGVTKMPVKLPYFNADKYKLPLQCYTAQEAPYVRKAHEDFSKFISEQITAYSNLSNSESKKGGALLEARLKAGMKTGKIPQPNPLQIAAGRKLLYWSLELQAETETHLERVKAKQAVIQALVDQHAAQQKAINDEYAAKMAQYDCGEGRGADCAAIMRLQKEECNAIVSMSATMQPQIAAAVMDKQNEELRFARRKFEKFAYYSYLAAPNKEIANGEYYQIASHYLSDLKKIAATPIIVAGVCAEQNEAPSKPESDGTQAMECPINLSVPFVVGKIELNCEKFAFSAGEGVTFKYEKDFGSKQSTISIGAGLQFEAGKAFGIFSGEVGASAEQSFYIVFDGDNNISDAGLALQVEVSAGAEASIDTPNGIGKEYFTKEILDTKGEFGYTLGVNSGWTFNDGTISSIAKSIGGVFKK